MMKVTPSKSKIRYKIQKVLLSDLMINLRVSFCIKYINDFKKRKKEYFYLEKGTIYRKLSLYYLSLCVFMFICTLSRYICLHKQKKTGFFETFNETVCINKYTHPTLRIYSICMYVYVALFGRKPNKSMKI